MDLVGLEKSFSAFFLVLPNLGENFQTDPQNAHISKSHTEGKGT